MFFKMEMNLFSSFDLYSGNKFFMFNILMILLTLFFSYKFWYLGSRNSFLILKMFFFLKKEFSLLIGKKLFGGNLIYISFFFFILQFNLFGMLPYTFTMTSQLNMNLYFSLTFFFIFLFLGWMKMPNIMMAHMTPLGSPNILSPFLVFIELISTMIRPMTLAVRLTANIISGHILMEILLGPSTSMTMILKIIFYTIMLPIFFLEVVVCFVQSFVISSLSSLYLSEPLTH